MLTTKLRRATDNEFIPVHLGSLALMVRGQIQVTPPSTKADPEGSKGNSSGVPGVTVNCVSLEDAQQCMAFAARHGILLSVFNGKTNGKARPTCDGGMAVDMSQVHLNVQ